MVITVGSLFSGIGGIELGLERTRGFAPLWFCENDAYASAVLKKHWPNVPNLGDITKVDWNGVERPDMLAGGFPCQDISVAGRGKGISGGSRSGLWRTYAEAIRILRPRYVLIENVPMLAKRGLDIVLSDLAETGYDAEWFALSAESVGAWHKRERIFIVAYPNSSSAEHSICAGGKELTGGSHDVPDATSERCNNGGDYREGGCFLSEQERQMEEKEPKGDRRLVGVGENSGAVPDRDITRLERSQKPGNVGSLWPHSNELIARRRGENRSGYWATEPGVGRVADGISNRVDRIKCLGNAVVPQVAEVVGRMILTMEEDDNHAE